MSVVLGHERGSDGQVIWVDFRGEGRAGLEIALKKMVSGSYTLVAQPDE
jgi:hypothetical protein